MIRLRGLLVPFVALALTACGTTGSTPEMEPGGEQSIYEQLPEAVRNSGTIVVGYQNNAGLPYGQVDEDGQDSGLNVEAAELIGKTMGVEVQLRGGDFDPLIPGLLANRYDLVTNVTTDTPERREVVDFTDIMYGEASSLVLPTGSELEGTQLADACGLRIAVNLGSSQEEKVDEQNTACTNAGKEPNTVLSLGAVPEMVLALKSGRADAVFLSMGASRYVAKTDSEVTLSQQNSEITELNGFMTRKDSDVGQALRATMLHLNRTGEWKSLLEEYGLGDLAPTDEVINNTSADYTPLLNTANRSRQTDD